MSEEEFDAKCRALAKEIDETPIEDRANLMKLLTQTESMRKEFVKLYELESE
jgi:hypothetical protein